MIDMYLLYICTYICDKTVELFSGADIALHTHVQAWKNLQLHTVIYTHHAQSSIGNSHCHAIQK